MKRQSLAIGSLWGYSLLLAHPCLSEQGVQRTDHAGMYASERSSVEKILHKDRPEKFICSWFAGQNSLLGELILKIIRDGKLYLLNKL